MGPRGQNDLFRLLNRLRTRINNLDIDKESTAMMQEINRARPDFRARLEKQGIKENVIQLVSIAAATAILLSIKDMPQIIEMMVKKVNSRLTDPAFRCSLAGILAYVVQPRDLIPDNAPGGYGYVDDNAILRAGLIEYLNILPPNASEAEKQRDYLKSFASIVPESVVPALQMAIEGISMTFQVLRMLPPQVLEMTTQQIIANPLQVTSPQAPSGFHPSPAPVIGGGHWSGGAYFEGGNVIVPGGPSLIDGKLFIPD
jgi:uncharacterized membrane protein YkvA (DUF1232 family)